MRRQARRNGVPEGLEPDGKRMLTIRPQDSAKRIQVQARDAIRESRRLVEISGKCKVLNEDGRMVAWVTPDTVWVREDARDLLPAEQ